MKSHLVLFSIFCVSFLLAQVPEKIQRYRDDQKGDIRYRRQGVMDGNLVRTIYYNTGEVCQWPFAPSLEWPKGSGHQNLDGYTFMVGASVKAPGNGQIIHPLEISYREEMPKDPVTGQIWGFEPLPGYAGHSVSSITSPAMSNDTNSLPAIWPAALGLSSDWNSKWYGYFGKGAIDGVQETFYVMDDSKDGKYKRTPLYYYPVAADSERGGLGLRVEVRGMQFQHQLLQDIIFWNYDVTNISDYDYDETAFGLFIDPGVGGVSSGNDDASYSTAVDLFYAWDHGGIGDPAYGNWKPGYVGISVLQSPQSTSNKNISSVSITPLSDKGPNGVWPKNNEVMWRKMTGGFVDTGITNSNISAVIGSNVFKFPKWTSEKFDVAVILGNDLSDVIMKKNICQIIHDIGFKIPDSLSKLGNLQLAIHSPTANSSISGNVNVLWGVVGAVGKTVSYVYLSSNTTDWVLIGVDSLGSKSFLWNTVLVPDGIFYSIRIMTIAENGIGFIESDKPFTINNSGNAKPEIRIYSPKVATNKMTGPTLQGTYAITWGGGDADGDSCVVNLYYKSSYDIQWTNIVSHANPSDGLYLWNTKPIPNGYSYLMKAEIISNADTTSVTISPLSIYNPAFYVSGAQHIVSKKTNGTGNIDIAIVDTASVTGHSYLLTFSPIADGSLSANIKDVNSGIGKLSGIYPLDYSSESKTFDGIRLRIVSDELLPDFPNCGWASGSSMFLLSGNFDSSTPSLDKPLPCDYQLTFSNIGVDTTIGNIDDPLEYPKIPVRFSITNLTKHTKAYSLVLDRDGSNSVTKGDAIKIVDDFVDPYNFHLIWNVEYGTSQSTAPEPTLGDIYVLKTKKPFTVGDSIVFTTQGLASVEKVHTMIPAEYSLSQNFPNPFNPVTIIQFSIPAAQDVVLRVYDILGKEITTLVHEKLRAGVYSTRFDGSKLSSGMYFYQLTAGGFSSTKKFLLVK